MSEVVACAGCGKPLTLSVAQLAARNRTYRPGKHFVHHYGCYRLFERKKNKENAMKLAALALALVLVGCNTDFPPFGCAAASSDGMLAKTCWRNVQICRKQHYATGKETTTAIAVDPVSGWLAGMYEATVGAISGWVASGGQPAVAAGGGVLGAADALGDRDDRPVCWEAIR